MLAIRFGLCTQAGEIQISNIEVEVIGDVPVGTCSLVMYYTKIIYVEVQRSEYRSFGDKDPICKHNECNCFNTKRFVIQFLR